MLVNAAVSKTVKYNRIAQGVTYREYTQDKPSKELLVLSCGTIVDERYEIVKVIGDGSMGTLYQVREVGLERMIALKLLHDTLITDDETRARFLREGKLASGLQHPCVVRVFRLGIWRSWPYIAMELLEGSSLRELLNRHGQLEQAAAIRIAIDVCHGMEEVHKAGIVHRDLKPNNIMVIEQDEGKAEGIKIVDFGLAQSMDQQSGNQKLTQTGQLIGSIYYMSPEQCQGLKASYTSDIYALGCVLYEAICGNPPLTADNPVGLVHLHISEIPKRLDEQMPEGTKILPGLNTVLYKAMAKNLDDRYASMTDFRQDLELLLAGNGDSFDKLHFRESAQKKSQKLPRRVILMTITGTVLCTIGLSVVSLLVLRMRPDPKILPSVSNPAVSDRQGIERLERRFRSNTGEERTRIADLLVDVLVGESQTEHCLQRTPLLEKALRYASYCTNPSVNTAKIEHKLGEESYRLFRESTDTSKNALILSALHHYNEAVKNGFKGGSLSTVAHIKLDRAITYASLVQIGQARADFDNALEFVSLPSSHTDALCVVDTANELQRTVSIHKDLPLKDRLELCDIFIAACEFVKGRRALPRELVEHARFWIENYRKGDAKGSLGNRLQRIASYTSVVEKR